MHKTSEQRIMELERQKASLEKQVDTAEEKSIFFDMMIDIPEKEFNISIRKKSLSEQFRSTQADKGAP